MSTAVAVDVVMPRLSDSMEEGTIVQWLKQPGDAVAVGDPLVEVETDKATMTYEADADGLLLEIVVAEGETAPLGELIARIGDPAAVASTNGRAAPGGRRIKASPVARRLAAGLGIELAALTGSGPGGRVVKADVDAAGRPQRVQATPPWAPVARTQPAVAASPAPARTEALAPAVADPAGDVHELTRVQAVIARRMAESNATVPDFVLYTDVDMTACANLRAQLRTLSGRAPTYNAMVVKAAALALRAFPRANGSYRDGVWVVHRRVNVGIAVAARESLLVPTVFDADSRALGAIAEECARLAGAVRDGSVTAAELSGGTFTVSNLGMFGVRAFSAIVNPPQAAILSVGELSRRPVVGDDDAIVARDVLTLGLVCDHRILYGAEAAGFLSRIRALLEQPLAMAL